VGREGKTDFSGVEEFLVLFIRVRLFFRWHDFDKCCGSRRVTVREGRRVSLVWQRSLSNEREGKERKLMSNMKKRRGARVEAR
jgi:hypothetical protein